jgi:hypothetical protein
VFLSSKWEELTTIPGILNEILLLKLEKKKKVKEKEGRKKTGVQTRTQVYREHILDETHTRVF